MTRASALEWHFRYCISVYLVLNYLHVCVCVHACVLLYVIFLPLWQLHVSITWHHFISFVDCAWSIMFLWDASFRFTDLKRLRTLDMWFQLQLFLIFLRTMKGMGNTLVRNSSWFSLYGVFLGVFYLQDIFIYYVGISIRNGGWLRSSVIH